MTKRALGGNQAKLDGSKVCMAMVERIIFHNEILQVHNRRPDPTADKAVPKTTPSYYVKMRGLLIEQCERVGVTLEDLKAEWPYKHINDFEKRGRPGTKPYKAVELLSQLEKGELMAKKTAKAKDDKPKWFDEKPAGPYRQCGNCKKWIHGRYPKCPKCNTEQPKAETNKANKTNKTGKANRRQVAAPAPAPTDAYAEAAGRMNVAAKFVGQVGSIEQARALLDSLEKLCPSK